MFWDEIYGKVEFLDGKGGVGETAYFRDKESFNKEAKESINVGRPISIVYNPHYHEAENEREK